MSAPCDFKCQLTGEVFIPSTWKKETHLVDGGTQTEPLETSNKRVQTVVSSMQVVEQLEKGEGTEPRKPGQASLEGLQYVYNGVTYDEEKLAKFVEGAEDGILTMLYRNARTNAFDSYEPNWSTKSVELAALYTLTSPCTIEGDLQALSISWNASGTMVAVAYGRMDTSGWCYNSGYVCVWNLVRPDLEESAPHYTLETDTYATAVAFHPTDALTLAVGTYSGEVLVFPSVTDDVPRQYSSNLTGAHRDPVSKLQWVQNLQEIRVSHRYLLCSSAQDSHIVLWTPANKLEAPLSVHSVRNKRHQPAGVQAMAYMRGVKSAEAGVGAGAAAPSVDGVLLVGLESGDVGRGRAGPPPAEAVGKEDTAGVAPMPLELDWLDGHQGPVQAVSASPFFRHLFATCSSDGSAHLYSDLERSPLLTLEPSAETKHFLYDVQFSPFRPSVLAMVSRSSYLHLYDLQASQSQAAYSREAGVDGAPVVSMAFNPAAAEWLATGDTRGAVRLWRLPTDLARSTELERAAVRADQHVGRGASATKETTTTPGDETPSKREGTVATTGVNTDAVRQLFGFTL